jgi:Cu/Ag efflux protein CusF
MIRLLLILAAIGMIGGAYAQENGDAVGIIHSIDAEGRMVSLTHDPIPAVGWPAMTMDLPVSAAVDLTRIKPDTIIVFTLERGPDNMYRIATIAPAPAGTIVEATPSTPMDHADHNMTLDADGMVMNANADTLPEDCTAISAEHEFTVRAARKFAEPFADLIFGYSQYVFAVEPCSRVTVTFINEDSVRHQWMLHGLPRYLYPQGMFHLEASGGATKSGTFIVPSDHRTYLVHCDMTQHMEKGLKAQLVVGSGNGNLPSVPGVTGPMVIGAGDTEDVWWHGLATALIVVAGCAIGVFAFRRIV